MKGNEIVLCSPPRGMKLEGIISGTPKPGTAMTIQANTAPIAGRFTWEPYETASGADGDPRLRAILDIDHLQGKTASDAYVSGTRGFLYVPFDGEEMNVLVLGGAGTGSANAFFIGDRLVPQHATGKFTKTSVISSTQAWFMVLEHIDEVPDVDTLIWVQAQSF